MNKAEYEQLSDFEINKLVALKVSFHPSQWVEYEDDMVLLCSKALNDSPHCVDSEVIDYCNNCADMWPLIFNNLIEIAPLANSENWKAVACSYSKRGVPTSYTVRHYNPLRASAIVYLLIND